MFDFFFEAIKNLKTVGTFTYSSKSLIKTTISPINFSEDVVIVELGAGNGCFTKLLLERMSPGSKIIAFELNPNFCKMMEEEIQDDRLTIICDSAEKIKPVLKAAGYKYADHFVSALPFVVFPEKVRDQIIYDAITSMKVNGKFCQISYSPVHLAYYKKVFGNVDLKFTLLNFPPAFSYICTNGQPEVLKANTKVAASV